MKLLVIGPRQSKQAQSPEGRLRQALQAQTVERYVVYTPHAGESSVQAAIRILRETKREDFDMVSAQDPFFVGLLAWRVARRARARLNVQVHADLDAQGALRHVLAQLVLRHADSVRVVSHKIQTQVQRLGVRAPIVVLPLYVDLGRYKAVVRQPERMVLWVGRFEPEKDPLLAIDVIKKIPGAKLVMLGQGSLERILKEKAKGMDVEFPGWQDPLPYLARAGAVLCTSVQESWGLSMVEALAAGVPVVAPDVGVAREAGAIVVPRGELARAVIEALTSGRRGELQISMPDREQWIRQWLATLP